MNEKLAQLAVTQHGLLTVAQVAEAGHEHLLRRRLRTDEWVREQPYVRDRQRDRWLYKTYGINTVRTTPRETRRRPDRVVDDIKTAYFRGLRRGRACGSAPRPPEHGSTRALVNFSGGTTPPRPTSVPR